MAEVGTYYITIMPDMSKFTGGVNKALGNSGTDGGKQYTSSFVDVLKGSALGTALGNLAASAGRSIMGGLQTGIGRIDTIQNFPKVMKSLGYESSEADKSIKLIMDHLDGLPTATQDVVALTQAIADSTGDLDLATRAALGFNDMMLANGASAGEVTQAQGVFNRVLGKGNATVAQWQSLQSVMPAQLAAVARELLGEGASVEELRDKLNDGTVSWNDFLQAIVDLDENDYMGATGQKIESFAEQAKANSVGIGTALENVQNRIGQGWAAILEAIGREDISSTINNMSYGVRDAMKGIADAITYLKDAIGKTNIVENLGKIAQTIGDTLGAIWNNGGPEMVKTFTDAMVALIDNVLQWMADHSDLVAAAVGAIVGAISALIGLQLGTWLAGLPAAFTALWTALSANPLGLIVTGIAAVTMGLYTFFTTTEEGKAIWEGFCQWVSDLWTGLQHDWGVLVDAVTQSIDGTKVQMEVFKQNIHDIVENIKRFVTGAWTALVDTVTKVVSNFVKGVVQKFIEIRDNVTTAAKNAHEAVVERFEAIRTAIVDKVLAARDNVVQTFENIKAAIKEKLEAAKEIVRQIIEKIKGLFNFKWSLPKPKIPHLNWHWLNIGNIVTIPVFDGISWYAKGGVFDGPTIAGLGEAGREAALPLNDRTYREMARGIVDQMDGGAGGVDIHDCTFVVRRDSDIEEVAQRLNTLINRERMAMA